MTKELIAASCLILLLAGLDNNLFSQSSPDATPAYTIYPFGDSITAGYGPPIQGGYRAPLFAKCKAAGIKIQFVGSSTRNSAIPILTDNNQTNHEGHGGYRIDQLYNNLEGIDNSGDSTFGGYWLAGGHGTGRPALKPDIILVHVGTNDILQKTPAETVEKRMQTLLDWLATNQSQAKIFVAKLLPLHRGPEFEAVEKDFNSWIEAKLSESTFADHGFILVDMNKPFLDAAGNVQHLPDGIHPDQEGYELMANIWFKAIQDSKLFPAQQP